MLNRVRVEIVHVPNSKVLIEPLMNCHIGFEYIYCFFLQVFYEILLETIIMSLLVARGRSHVYWGMITLYGPVEVSLFFSRVG